MGDLFGKGGGGGPQITQDMINQQAYQYGMGGQRWVDIDDEIPFGHDQALEWWLQGQRDARGGGGGGFDMGGYEFDFGGYEAPEPPDPLSTAGTSYDDIKELLGGISQEEGMIYGFYDDKWQKFGFGDVPEDMQYGYSYLGNPYGEGRSGLDEAYGAYLDAAGVATDYVNSQIRDELANANLLGIDYNVTEEQKQTRINDYFSTLWSESNQTQLEQAMAEFGEPTGFEGFSVVRGTGETLPAEGEETTVAESRGVRPATYLETEEEALGGQGTSMLGA